MLNLEPYFYDHEFNCKCGCGLGFADMDKQFLQKLLDVRIFANCPFVIVSGIRCQEHNNRVGGKPNSSHIKGHAVDISCNDSSTRHKIIKFALQVGFNRIGIAKTFIHLDDDNSLPQKVIWMY